MAHVADILCGGAFFGLEHGDFFAGAHIGIIMIDAILGLDAVPGALPIGPGAGHTDGFQLALLFCAFHDLVQG